jgi:Domain of unknown function (DUF4760)
MGATREDAQLMVQLAQLFVTSGGPEASGWMWSDDFVSDPEEFKQNFPFGSPEARHLNAIASFNETVATLTKRGLLDEELVLDWLAVHVVWERLKEILLDQREQSGEPRLWENFEALAERSRAFAPA